MLLLTNTRAMMTNVVVLLDITWEFLLIYELHSDWERSNNIDVMCIYSVLISKGDYPEHVATFK